jgi:hypothetical protein
MLNNLQLHSCQLPASVLAVYSTKAGSGWTGPEALYVLMMIRIMESHQCSNLYVTAESWQFLQHNLQSSSLTGE